MARVAVVIPTVSEREEHYERCKESYLTRTPGHEVSIYTEKDHPTLGLAWQAGVEQVNLDDYDYLHLTCDDGEALDGWIKPAIECVEVGFIPAPVIREASTNDLISFGHPPDGVGMIDWKPTTTTVAPFCKAEWWKRIGPMIPTHLYTDDWFSHQARLNGWDTRCRLGYEFRHHHAMPRRGAGMEEQARHVYDMHIYNRVLRGGDWPTREEAIGC